MLGMASPTLPPISCCPVHLSTSLAQGPRAHFLRLQSLLNSFWLARSPVCLSNAASVFPSFRKEVGLDLFFPKQMQENLKVREAEGKEPGKPCSVCVLG